MGIKLLPLAAESLGVRSMCTYIETPDVRLLLDAGAALGPRFGLLPHPQEYRALAAARRAIREFSQKADLITVSHYHYDHFTHPWPNVEALWTWCSRHEAQEVYGGKRVYIKDYRSKINASQRRRGYEFYKEVSSFAELVPADGLELRFGPTLVKFLGPFTHGEEAGGLGYVLCVLIKRDAESLCFYPDLQGPLDEGALELLKRERPQVLILGGPPVYLRGYKVTEEQIAKAIANLKRAIALVGEVALIEHHLLRDAEGLRLLEVIKEEARGRGVRVGTFAEFRDMKPNPLEARRTELYQKDPPDKEFIRWTRLPPEERAHRLPPL